MVDEIRDYANWVYRDYFTLDTPSSGSNKPVKSEIRALFDIVEDEIDARVAVVEDIAVAAAAGVAWKSPVRAATTVDGTLASAFDNASVIDGVTLATGDRILIKNQSSSAANGIYVVQASGAPVRATDADSEAELVSAGVAVEEGTENIGTAWVQTTAAPITVGSTSLAFVKITDQSVLATQVADAVVDVAALGEGSTAPVDTSGYSMKLVDSAGRVLLAFDGEGNIADSHGFVTRVQTELAIRQAPIPITDNVPEHGISFTYTDWNGCAIMGQSNGSAGGSGALSTTQPFNNKNSAGAPLVSTSGAETSIMGTTSHAKWRQLKEMRPWDSWAIDYDFVWSAINSPSGTPIAEISQGTATYNAALASVTTSKNSAVTAGATHAERAVLFLGGEDDSNDGTTQAAFLAAFIELKNDWNADVALITGQTDRIPMFVAQVAIGDTGMVTPTKSTVVKAMLEAAETDDEIFIIVPGYILEFGPDGLHYTNYDQRRIGEYFGKALHRYYIEGRNPSTVRPTSWTILDTRTIEVEFYVPVPPLVFDVERVWPVGVAMGFSVYDSGGVEVTISNVKIINGTKVQITTAVDVAAGYDVAYAFKTYSRAGTGGLLAGRRRGGRGNLRDSDATLAYYPDEDGNEIRLPNWCVIFRKTLA